MIALILFLVLVVWTVLGLIVAFAKAVSPRLAAHDTRLELVLMTPVIALVFLWDKFLHFIKKP